MSKMTEFSIGLQIWLCVAISSFSIPAYSFVTNNSPCTNDTLTVQSGSASLVANWQGNPISLNWYETSESVNPISGIASASQSCTYGGSLTPPATIPTRTGYTFKGWRARNVPLCGLTTSILSSDGTGRGYIGHDNLSRSNDTYYGLSSPGDWATEFNHGIFRGNSSCNDVEPSAWAGVLDGLINETMTPTQAFAILWGNRSSDSYETSLSTNTTGIYCWCHAVSYTPNGGSACNLSTLSWVIDGDNDTNGECSSHCADVCAEDIEYIFEFRKAVFGVQ